MKDALICIVDDLWYAVDGKRGVQAIPERSGLSRPAQVLVDFPEATIGLYRAEVEKRFALPTIEKRLRNEGLIEGESRLLPHWTHSVSGTTSCFLTAVRLRDWQAYGDWAHRQPYPVDSHALGQLLVALTRRHGCVTVRWGRQLHFAAWHRGEMAHESVVAYQEEPEVINSALDSLLSRVERDQVGRAIAEAERIHWFDLFATTLAADPEDAEAHAEALRRRMAGRLGKEVTAQGKVRTIPMPGEEPELDDSVDERASDAGGSTVPESGGDLGAGPELEMLEEPLAPLRFSRFLRYDPSLASMVSRTPVLEEPWVRAVNLADRFRTPLAAAAIVASCGLGLLTFQNLEKADSLQARAALLQAEADRIAADMPALPPPTALLEGIEEDLTLVADLAAARQGPSLGTVLLDLQDALGDARIRIMRIAAADGGSAYRIEGMFDAGADADLTRFVSRLAAAGYDTEALDPGSRSRGTGFFSYLLRKEGVS
ncbi:MAG: hypothetical protein ACP5DC_00160 [Halothiobacillaceae bacterium]